MVKTEITGIVLAGGKSSRFGSDKSMALWKGKTLIENAVDILRPKCTNVVISSNNLEYKFTGCEVWQDELPVQAPMIGIYSCLKRSGTEINIVLSCDMPLIPGAIFDYLLSKSEDYKAIVPIHNFTQIEPLCGIYKRSLIPDFEKYIKEETYSLQQFLNSKLALIVSIDPILSLFQKDLFLNINTMDDFNNIPKL